MLTPSRLAIARKRHGLTLTRLSELTGLSTHSLSVYENGHQVPSEETLQLLADVLGISPEFLAGHDLEEIPPDAVSFRALSKMTARQRDRALSAGRVALLIDDWIDARFRLPEADIPSLTDYPPESAAEVVRARWGLGERPVSNMLHLLEAHGVRIYSLTVENNELDAYSLFWHARPFIFLSTAKSGERGRFDAAHELGHLVLHGEYQELNRPVAEQEANRFAAAFLMPRSSVLAQGLRDATATRILRAKSVWKVAAMALTHRLYELDLLTDWGYRTICVQLSRLGYRRSEPDGIPRESSQLLSKVFRSIREDGESPATIAAVIGISSDELQEHVFGLTLTTLPGGQHRVLGSQHNGIHLVPAPHDSLVAPVPIICHGRADHVCRRSLLGDAWRLAGEHHVAFSIVLVGNQIADYGRYRNCVGSGHAGAPITPFCMRLAVSQPLSWHERTAGCVGSVLVPGLSVVLVVSMTVGGFGATPAGWPGPQGDVAR